MFGLAKFLAVCLLAALAAAHMEMSDPPPLKSRNNPNAGSDVDYNLVAPITGDAFPCKGYLSLLDAPEGASVATWEAGSTQSITIIGGATHGGGSCQVSLSLDAGKTFTVIHSYVGGCPKQGESSFKFRVPADTPASDQAVLSWSWLNQIGNREFYQNCAAVTIKGGKEGGEDLPFDQRPAMFTANLRDGCSTAPSADVMFPEPGPDADINNPDAAAPVGECAGSGGAPAKDAPAKDAPASGAPAGDGSSATAGGAPADGSSSPGAGSGAPPADGCGNTSTPQGPGARSAEAATQDDPMSWVTGAAADGPSEQALSALVVGAAIALAIGMSLA